MAKKPIKMAIGGHFPSNLPHKKFGFGTHPSQTSFFNYRTISEMVKRTADDSLDSYFALCKKSSTKSSGLSQRSMLSYRFAIKQIEVDNYFFV